MKIAYLMTDIGIGSFDPARSVHSTSIINNFITKGNEVVMISSVNVTGLKGAKFFLIPAAKIKYVSEEFAELLYNIRFILNANKILKREKPEAIYQRYSINNFAGTYLSRKHRIPLISEVNNSEVLMRKKFGKLSFEKISVFLERTEIENSEYIAVVSEQVKNDLIGLYNVNEKRIFITPNAVNPEVFNPDISGKNIRKKYGLNKKIIVGHVGSFRIWHGAIVLAKAVAKITKNHKNIHFLFVGDGGEKQKVEEYLRKNRLTGYCTFTSAVLHQDIPGYMAACDILVSPHILWKDFFGSPTKIFEYMAMEKPIIVSSIGQMKEILTDENTALLVEPENVSALAGAIIRLSTDNQLRQKLGRNARNEVVKKYTWDKNAEKILDFMKKAISDRNDSKAKF